MNTITLSMLMQLCINEKASDIHLSAGSPPLLRKNTRLAPVSECPALTSGDVEAMLQGIIQPNTMEEYTKLGSADFAYQFEDGTRFRGSVFRQKDNCTAVLRRISEKIIPLEHLALPGQIIDVCQRTRGLFLVTGPTGSGKTTTLASMIDWINRNQERHILTFEDPIEYIHDHNRSLVNQRQIGSDVPDFPEALRRGLRQDPDIILVGEMRDLETMRAAVSAAETGHLVFATLHTVGASASVNRIVDAFPADEKEHLRTQISTGLIGVLSQALCPRIDGNGVVAAYEFLLATHAIQKKIRDQAVNIDDDIQIGKKFGMQLLDDHLLSLVLSGTILEKVAIEKARDPIQMKAKLTLAA